MRWTKVQIQQSLTFPFDLQRSKIVYNVLMFAWCFTIVMELSPWNSRSFIILTEISSWLWTNFVIGISFWSGCYKCGFAIIKEMLSLDFAAVVSSIRPKSVFIFSPHSTWKASTVVLIWIFPGVIGSVCLTTGQLGVFCLTLAWPLWGWGTWRVI